jgi:hypothetical protein
MERQPGGADLRTMAAILSVFRARHTHDLDDVHF